MASQQGTGPSAAPQDSTAVPPAGKPGDLGSRVSRRRQERKLSGDQRAELAGVSVPYLTYPQTQPARSTGGPASTGRRAADHAGGAARRRPGGGASGRPVLQTLNAAECYDLLAPGGVGRVAFTTGEGPVVVPVNYAMAGQTVIFRTAPDTLLAGYLDGPAGFEVDRLDEALSQGWSVLVTGRAVRVTSEADVRHLEQHTDIRPWAGGARDVYVRIIPRKITGRRIHG